MELSFLKWKITCEVAFQNLLKSCVSFGGGLEGSSEEKMWRQQKEELLYSEMCGNAIRDILTCLRPFENPTGLSVFDVLIETVKYIWVNI